MKRRKKGPDIKLPVIGLFLLLFLLISFIFIKLKNSWDGKSRFTITVQNFSGDKPENFKLAIISVEPKSLLGSYILIDHSFMLEIPYGYKTYPVYSVYKLGELDKSRGGGKLLKKSIETTFGLKTDRYLALKSKLTPNLPESKEQFGEFRKNYFSLLTGLKFLRLMITSIESDLNLIEKFRFYLAVRNLYASRLNFIDLSKSNAYETIKLADNTKVKNVDPYSFDNLISTDFQDISVRQEGYTIEVQNATGQDKIAGQFSRILENLGANIIFTSTAAEEASNNCQLIFIKKQIKNSIITGILKRNYGCVEASAKGINIQSDIKLILGHDFLK